MNLWAGKNPGLQPLERLSPWACPLYIAREVVLYEICDFFLNRHNAKWKNDNYGYNILCMARICSFLWFLKQGHFGMQLPLILRLPTSTSPHSMGSSVLMCPSFSRPQPNLGCF